ncbi:hypothetical protein GCM10010245_88020 [Streptomyces spectabilis]|nr:hypothetical protein GCM10010245_88020 [Streptomyces spectabilis]
MSAALETNAPPQSGLPPPPQASGVECSKAGPVVGGFTSSYVFNAFTPCPALWVVPVRRAAIHRLRGMRSSVLLMSPQVGCNAIEGRGVVMPGMGGACRGALRGAVRAGDES